MKARTSNPRSSIGSVSGFTILELLVATAVTMLMSVLLLSMVQYFIDGYRRTQNSMSRQGDSSFALDQIVQDIENRVIPNSPNSEGLRSTWTNVELAKGVWLTLLSTATDRDPNSNSGATRAISYRIDKKNPIDGSATQPAYALYRSIASAKHTFENAMSTNVSNLQTDYWNHLPAAPVPTPSQPTDKDNFIAPNIVEFQVRFLRADNGKWTQPEATVSISRSGALVDGVPVPGGFKRAEVSLMTISPEGATKLASGMPMEEVIARYSQTSVRQTAAF